MLRIIPTAAHSLEDVQKTLDAFGQMGEKLKAGYYKENKLVVA
jgi:glycine C-acetyltransferase